MLFHIIHCQGAVIGVDVVGEDSVDHFLGAKKKMEENASHGDGEDVKYQPAGKHPASLDTPEHMEACADSSTSTRYEFGVHRGLRAYLLF